ncbi:WXG100 family type VII secretion target [Streptomyces sp. ODS28]|uniref:WXG100 family type VII secretion target n=1 Tax=Streptomyces sp. ODS28 TaxID=3136688 RepID=UPI0031EB1F21
MQYRVTPEYLAGASADAAKTANQIASDLAELKSYVVSLESSWQGVAHQQFQTLMQQYDNYARMLHQALTGISKGLQGNYVNYKESEERNLSNLHSLGADIPTPSGGSGEIHQAIDGNGAGGQKPVANFD